MSGRGDMPAPPANLEPYVKALGVEGAMALFLSVGGSEIYLPKHSTRRSLAARTIGADKVDQLVNAMGYGYYKVPLAREWCAEVLRAKGESIAEIARTIRADVATVRRWLPSKEITSEQLTLFPKTGT